MPHNYVLYNGRYFVFRGRALMGSSTIVMCTCADEQRAIICCDALNAYN